MYATMSATALDAAIFHSEDPETFFGAVAERNKRRKDERRTGRRGRRAR